MGFVFYKRYMEETKRLRVLKIINPKLFSQNCTEISWKMLKDEFYSDMGLTESFAGIIKYKDKGIPVCLECDEMLLGGFKLHHPIVYEKDVSRMVYSKQKTNDLEIDFLYSEISNLSGRV